VQHALINCTRFDTAITLEETCGWVRVSSCWPSLKQERWIDCSPRQQHSVSQNISQTVSTMHGNNQPATFRHNPQHMVASLMMNGWAFVI